MLKKAFVEMDKHNAVLNEATAYAARYEELSKSLHEEQTSFQNEVRLLQEKGYEKDVIENMINEQLEDSPRIEKLKEAISLDLQKIFSEKATKEVGKRLRLSLQMVKLLGILWII